MNEHSIGSRYNWNFSKVFDSLLIISTISKKVNTNDEESTQVELSVLMHDRGLVDGVQVAACRYAMVARMTGAQ